MQNIHKKKLNLKTDLCAIKFGILLGKCTEVSFHVSLNLALFSRAPAIEISRTGNLEMVRVNN